MSLLELLSTGQIDAFNASRGVHRAPDLFAADLSGLDLRGADLSRANLEKADLSECDLRGVDLSGANLRGADLTKARMAHGILIGAHLQGAYVDQADLDGTDFSGADLTEAVLNGSEGDGVILNRARLRRAELKNVQLPDAQLREARLENADLTGARLDNCDLHEARLNGASLESANLEGASCVQARGRNASFHKASMRGAKLTRMDLTAADLREADLRGASLVEADLTEAVLQGANLEGADLARACVERVEGAELDASVAEVQFPERPAQVVVEDPHVALCGDAIGMLWENEEDETTLANRVAVLRAGEAFQGRAPALRSPAELTLARCLVATEGHLAAAVLLERTGGVELQVTRLDAEGGEIGFQTMRLGYEPAVAPVMRGGDRLTVVGIGRRGPTLHVHHVTAEGGLEHAWSKTVPTARGLLGQHNPLLLTRGGVVHVVGEQGLGAPIAEPEGFAIRGTSACVHGPIPVVGWMPQGHQGLRWSRLEGRKPEVHKALGQSILTSLELVPLDDHVAAFYCKEEPAHQGACALWRLPLGVPDAKPIQVVVDPALDIEEARAVAVDGDRVVLRCTTLADEVLVVASESGGSEILARF